MTPLFKDKLRQQFRDYTKRDPTPSEDVNMENDTVLMIKTLYYEYERLLNDIEILKKK